VRPANRIVFLSHAGSDTWVALQIAHGIKACGARAFLDESEIQAGRDFESQILAFLGKADELVVLLTPWSLERPYVWAELGAAWIRKIPIIAILYGLTTDDLQKRPGAPVFLKSKNCKQLNEVSTYFKELRTRVTKRGSKKRAA
jgi:hypothetical protein